MQMQWTSWATIAALAVYVWTAANVSRARARYKVIAPAVDGPPEFLRAMRVQINTSEQIILFLPCLWLCTLWFSDHTAGIGGAIWVLGRIWYALTYYRDASKRATGFVLAMTASLSLLLLAVVGLLR
ncbi:MAPEG family protein [Undibacterium sp. Jales W-56]|uniref:MAPEG family protein n=1 Tax=Undibacterium sp. Jales W-56 TaxID=2897325 RepID=UPI0021D0838F|nr:MAPEG family protein [Undibacterium sp. Jales W-56]MCU6434095.1 MAPEG family protein [Undibacterium sp. Jales W-56]